MTENIFNLELIVEIIQKYGYKTIVLQFVDEYLIYCIDVYTIIRNSLNDSVKIFIAADSTWGSSSDDISAKHISGDLLVYFGTDLSTSSAIPVLVAPLIKSLNINDCCNKLLDAIEVNSSSKIILFYDPNYYWAALKLSFLLPFDVCLAKLPIHADLEQFTNDPFKLSDLSEYLCVGGLFIPRSTLLEDDLRVIYVGDKTEQINKINLRVASSHFYHYQPSDRKLNIFLGRPNRQLQERFGGIMKVEQANIIGIIIGSMGLSTDLTRSILNRIQKLLRAAGKKHYIFVMGRINESKLCNFPEIDIFCLIANEDVSLIKPKEFPVPVITPYELEIGLGGQEWDSNIITNLDEIIQLSIESSVEKINVNLDSDIFEESNDIIKLPGLKDEVIKSETRELSLFTSAAIDYYNQRSFKGMDVEKPENVDYEIKQGKFGIATNYKDF